jgi:hypothetical protein
MDASPKAETRTRIRFGRLATAMVALVAVLAGVLCLGTQADAAVPTGNLVQNPNAEIGTGASDSSTVSPTPIPGWITTPNFTEHVYSETGAFPDPDASSSIGGGAQFFAGGPNAADDNATETARQDVSVAASASEIDAGEVAATLSAALGGYSSQEDNAMVTASFLNANGNSLGKANVGPVTASDRSGETVLLRRSATANVPAGTRTIRVTITAKRLEGTYNDGYADNVSLSLKAVTASPVATITAYAHGKQMGFKGPRTVKAGSELAIVNDTDPQQVGPHTFTLVSKKQLPTGRKQMKNCERIKSKLCKRIVRAHRANPKTGVVKRPDVDVGKSGWDRSFGKRGDSWFMPGLGSSTERIVSAKPGTTLHYFCVIHPWMQGKIKVVK